MKCPKCGYISFDYNQVCPKCSKDISAEQTRLNLPSFRPDTPFLLEALVGEGEESGIGLDSGTYVDIEGDTAEFGTDMGFGDTGTVDNDGVEFGDTPETDEEADSAVVDEELLSTFDFEELEADTSDEEVAFDTSVTDFDLESDEEGIDMTSGEITEEAEEEAEISLSEPGAQEDASLDDFDLAEGTEGAEAEPEEGEEMPEVAVVPEGIVGQDVTLDMDSPDSDLQEAARATDLWTEDSEEVSLDLDDLSVDETGELKVDTEEAVSEEKDDPSLDLDDLDLELDLDDSEEKPS
jgi:hypothetical protein